MSHSKFRTDKECENCGFTVEVAFCSKCGQKNVETRQNFPSLVGHFAEDLTHYDSAFWKSLKHLLFRPGRLTRVYLEGKRQEYVPPVKLYIFISFITFLMVGLLPDATEDSHEAKTHKENPVTTIDTINNTVTTVKTEIPKEENEIHVFDKTYHTIEDVDKAYEKGELNYFFYHFIKEMVKKKDAPGEAISEAIVHAIPKAIFLYMPLFTFWLWLFHGKKRWYFFDHGIFTLHYFSFLLLTFTILYIIGWAMDYISTGVVMSSINSWVTFIVFVYSFFYFFRSHRRMYGESRAISRIKSLALFFINMVCISIATALLILYAFMHVH